jgi:hypothetical protein
MALNTEKQLLEGFVDALNAIPQSRAKVRDYGTASWLPKGVDAVVDASLGGHDVLLLIETKQTAFPRDVREALWRLKDDAAHMEFGKSDEFLIFIIADAISPGAREEVRKAGAGYFDMSGSLYVPAENAFVFVDRPSIKTQARALTSVFQGRKAGVLRNLFAHRQEWVGVKELADWADVSPATTSETLTELERRDWVETRGAGPTKKRRLTRAGEMLDAWARDLSSRPTPRFRRYFVPSADVEHIVSNLAGLSQDTGAQYAITGEMAAQAYAPYLSNVSQVRCRMRLDNAAKDVLAAMRARPVDAGWNLAVLETRDTSDFSDVNHMNGVNYASPLQAYLDLQHGSGRAKELAEHLRNEQLSA